MGKRVNKKVGRIFPTNCGVNVLVLDYVNTDNILVEFQDDFKYRSVVSATNLNKGKLFNPYHKSVHGVGYLGEGQYVCQSKGVKTRPYIQWASAMTRCYSEISHNKGLSYVGCTVQEDWHCYQNFGGWYDAQEYKEDEWQLDKDLLVRGNKVYSANTCCILPQEINSAIIKRENYSSKLPLGVSVRGKTPIFSSAITVGGKRKNLGTFKTAEQAHHAYKLVKESHVQALGLKWKGKISTRAFEALLDWKLN